MEGNSNTPVILKIYDYTGKLIKELSDSMANDIMSIDLSAYSKGLYHAEVIQGSFRKVVKLNLNY